MKSDELLIKRCQKGDIDAFEELISKYQKTAYNIALKTLKNPEDAMDASQEALIKVYKSMKTFKSDSKFSTWLYRIVVNTCLDYIKKQSKAKVYSLDKELETNDGEIKREVRDNSLTPEEAFEKKETKKLVRDSIHKLDEKHKAVIVLRDIEGFSYDEIADIIECNIGTVKSRIKRAREKLKQIILNEMEQNKIKSV